MANVVRNQEGCYSACNLITFLSIQADPGWLVLWFSLNPEHPSFYMNSNLTTYSDWKSSLGACISGWLFAGAKICWILSQYSSLYIHVYTASIVALLHRGVSMCKCISFRTGVVVIDYEVWVSWNTTDSHHITLKFFCIVSNNKFMRRIYMYM